MPLSDSTESQIQDAADKYESRSYDPYFIAYHEETNTFTFNDPWAQVDESNSSCFTETNLIAEAIVTAKEFPIAHASVPDSNGCKDVENSTELVYASETQGSVTHSGDVSTEPEVEIEHVAEVSFPLNTIKNR